MVTKPKLSVITVVYNDKKNLEKTILSILGQDYGGIEFIIIDGNSTDGTIDTIKSYEEHIQNWKSEPDKGIYDAMNKGMELATGDYICFINAGDSFYNKSTVSKVFTINEKADVYYGQTMIVDEKGGEVGLRRLKPGSNFTWKDYRFGQLISHQSFIAKMALSPLYDLRFKYSADTDWQLKILRKAEVIIDTKLVLTRYLEGGRSRKTIIPSLKERFLIMIKNYGFLTTFFSHVIISVKFFWFLLLHRRF
jgi:glycosyltransferase involved in cell wall biosynthesis